MFVYLCAIWSESLWESVKIETFVLGLLPISISFTHFNLLSVNFICWLIAQITAERMILMILLPDKETHLSHYQMCQGVLNGNLTQWQLRGMIHWVVKTAGWDLCLSLLGFTLCPNSHHVQHWHQSALVFCWDGEASEEKCDVNMQAREGENKQRTKMRYDAPRLPAVAGLNPDSYRGPVSTTIVFYL